MTLRMGLEYQQSIGAHDVKYLSNWWLSRREILPAWREIEISFLLSEKPEQSWEALSAIGSDQIDSKLNKIVLINPMARYHETKYSQERAWRNIASSIS